MLKLTVTNQMDVKKIHTSYYSGLSGLQLQIPKYKFPPPLSRCKPANLLFINF